MGAALKWLGGVLLAVIALPLAIAMVLLAVLVPPINQELEPKPCNYGAGGTMVAGGWTVPMGEPYQLRSPFGMRMHPIYHEWRMHQGQDIISTVSTSSPILAVHAGVVTWASYGTSDAGNNVNIDHGGGVVTRYMHLKTITVTVGQQVTTGQQIGIEGTTGASTGEHLHFEYREGADPAQHTSGTPVDPVAALASKGIVWDGSPGGPDPTTATSPQLLALTQTAAPGTGEGGIGFALPEPGEPRYVSLHNVPIQPSAEIRGYYDQAAAASGLPWTLLAGIGMEETEQGTNIIPHPAGARGIMQFLPSTWAEEGRDGNGDGVADIDNPADSIMSAAFYLVKNGAKNGPAGVKAALRVYNPRDFYLNDVLYYAKAYGSGLVLGGQANCQPANGGAGDPSLPPLTPERVQQMFAWARARVGLPYQLGANGPDAYDCSSYTQATFASIGISVPRTAREQRDWLARGNGYRVQPGQEQPGDLVFTNTWLGPDTVGHVMMVYDPATHTSLEEASKGAGFYHYDVYANHHIYEIWRVGNLADHPAN